jgi:hypothetical protein
MAKGDQTDFVRRLAGLLPASWFEPGAGANPVRDAELNGAAYNLSWIHSLYKYTLKQTRIATATGVWLDRISWDFFGPNFARRNGEPDSSFRVRLKAEILRPRQTRVAISLALTDLTGVAPLIFEPWNPRDCGAYGVQGTMAYGCVGCYGSLQPPYQIFVTAVQPPGAGVPNVGGYGAGAVGYGVAGEYIDQSQVVGAITEAEIYATVAKTVAAGVTAWTDIVGAFPPPPETIPTTFDALTPTFDSGTVTMDHF